MFKAKKLYFALIFKESSNYNKFALKKIKMQNLSITQNLNQKLSPQQIQFMKLLHVSSSNIEGIIKKELEANPALEEENSNLSTEDNSNIDDFELDEESYKDSS